MIAETLTITAQKAARGRWGFLVKGLAGVEKDGPRPGRLPAIAPDTVAEVVRLTRTRSMAQDVGISDTSVLRIWHAHGLKPHRSASFKVSNDSHFAEKMEAVMGL